MTPPSTPIAEPGAAIGYAGPLRRLGRRMRDGRTVPVLTVVLAILAIWYLAAIGMNWATETVKLERAGEAYGALDTVAATWSAERPVLPAPHQIVVEIWNSTVGVKPSSPRSLLYHAWVTLSSTLLGFLIGTALGVLLAVGILNSRTLDKSLMPWIIASQTIPILAIAPMVIVVLNSVGVTGLLPKAIISTYLSFFPVAVGMVKGLRSPDAMLIDLMHTYSATRRQTLVKLRWPASMPFLFTSMKVAVAAALVGAIVGELPTGAVAGLGARLLAGSYYGQTIQIWSALVAAAIMAGVLVWLIGLGEKASLKRMGARP
ncbi:MAG: ABC transporter permease [Aurantimonas coralicida]|uniref:ABC transporter permease n=1 Tax=Aurantimonas TaxID=182269 RepID=UPI0016521F19|nr:MULTISPECIES: ABC transporter permease [Aurantimonas]MBC6716446.1 ABC transporter permease [Aurantimonas sp. DM33-3]MCC4297451.1 ABC transporter permease [Aurantimonas coralicida]MCW7542459.1 ABC transporter permease [Aurantimonas litoralis]MDE0921711.1 ABC transporter permease [Aurantimonas coralicida]